MPSKWFFRIISYCFSLVLASILSIGMLASTESGSLFLVQKISQSFVKNFHYQNFSGVLLDHFSITGLYISNKHFDLSIEKLSFTWRPVQLLHFNFLLDQCVLSNGYLHVKPQAVAKEKSAVHVHFPLWLPSIHMHALQINDVVIEESGNHFSLENVAASFDLQKNRDEITVQKFQASLQGRKITGAGQFIGSNDQLLWKNCFLKTANSLAHIDGVLGRTSHLIWDIHIGDLAYWLPKSSGTIISKGQVIGDWQDPSVQALIDVNQLQAFDFSLRHLKATAEMKQNKISTINLSASKCAYKKYLIFNLLQADFSAYFMAKSINIKGEINSDWGKILLQGVLPGWQNQGAWLDQKMQANINWRCDHFPVLNNALIQDLQGTLFAKAAIEGAVKNPKINVAVEIHNASMNVVTLNLFLKNIRLSVNGWLDKTVKVIASFDSTEGHAAVSGEMNTLFSDPQILLKLVSNELLLVDLPAYKIWASSHLQLHYQKSKCSLIGSVVIPKAHLKPVAYDKKVLQLSPDVKFVEDEYNPIKFFAKLDVLLGEAIDFHYGGVSGLLHGRLKLKVLPDLPTTAVGNIDLQKGVYAAYGQSLTIQKGSATFRGGDVLNPELTVEATKNFAQIAMAAVPGYAVITHPDGSLTVGILISGPVLDYQVQLFSDPAGLNQTDILSYLILGSPASEADGGGVQILLSAASVLTDKGGGQLSPVAQLKNQLQEAFGVEVNVGKVSQYNANIQSVEQGTGLILTKKLSSKLSVNYSAGIGQAINQFEVRYQLNRHWMAQTNSSSMGNGGDIFYTVNR